MKNDLAFVKTSGRCFGVRVSNSTSGIRGEASVQCLILFWIATIAGLMRGVGGGLFWGRKIIERAKIGRNHNFYESC